MFLQVNPILMAQMRIQEIPFRLRILSVEALTQHRTPLKIAERQWMVMSMPGITLMQGEESYQACKNLCELVAERSLTNICCIYIEIYLIVFIFQIFFTWGKDIDFLQNYQNVDFYQRILLVNI
eukprot:TRINITY_DN5618_c0_g1_i9.p4 TRINITY_DN5618_c0_g1~~TRINITY_DN5618_c0_g1_i9.p4  ORF type:complete len:124 (-),score=4.10 TRINITY_DN5618_c0_g1_i9:224-595(-)